MAKITMSTIKFDQTDHAKIDIILGRYPYLLMYRVVCTLREQYDDVSMILLINDQNSIGKDVTIDKYISIGISVYIPVANWNKLDIVLSIGFDVRELLSKYQISYAYE